MSSSRKQEICWRFLFRRACRRRWNRHQRAGALPGWCVLRIAIRRGRQRGSLPMVFHALPLPHRVVLLDARRSADCWQLRRGTLLRFAPRNASLCRRQGARSVCRHQRDPLGNRSASLTACGRAHSRRLSQQRWRCEGTAAKGCRAGYGRKHCGSRSCCSERESNARVRSFGWPLLKMVDCNENKSGMKWIAYFFNLHAFVAPECFIRSYAVTPLAATWPSSLSSQRAPSFSMRSEIRLPDPGPKRNASTALMYKLGPSFARPIDAMPSTTMLSSA
mmetsp:Transcript_10252/g.23189  ORF Transcript_10252/g.23189 Transcript_10252/m.23189 type:complete len:276 (-) Transcript_10252:708-1535(-)